MKKLILLFAAAALFMVSCNQAIKGDKTTEQTKTEETVNATIEQLIASPADFENKEVVLSGMVTHVCKHGGQKCFVLAQDGETQLRINVGASIDEFDVAMEGSTVEFTGTFKILTETESAELQEDHESQAHHENEMAHTEAEKADYFVEATSYKEITD
jgi:hypothetical protein